MPSVCCSECVYGRVSTWKKKKVESYAFVLRNGHNTLDSVWAQETACLEKTAMPGVTAYCGTCRKITWLTCLHDDLQQALVSMQIHRERWLALAGMRS